ncbi:MAG: lysylphosphatidylglycerol synthase transmembrane domain-containing protein [Elusimicrobia bacterium]|nr:lysylphosphatidylglycerol synthase transmembrane domain-containing protein [Elusimicrobiota bacterium]
MAKQDLKKKLFIYAPIGLSLAILAALVYPNLDALLETVKTTDTFYLLCALFFSFTSYLFIGMSLWEVLKILGHRLPFWEAAGVAFVSTTVNYFVSSAGVSGFATRAHLLSQRRVPYGTSVTSSVVITVFIYLVLAVIIVEGMFLQMLKSSSYGITIFQGVAGVLFVLTFAFVLVLLFFHHELRSVWARKLYHLINHLMFFFSRKEIPEETFILFESQLAKGIHTIQARKFELPLVLAYVCLDWVSNILILHFAFMAVGVHLHTSTLVIGFALGQLMTIIPILPGGLGAMEAAMTAAYAGMGVPVGQALMASLVFRLFYYLVPAFGSVFVYWGLRVSEKHYENAAAPNDRHKGERTHA